MKIYKFDSNVMTTKTAVQSAFSRELQVYNSIENNISNLVKANKTWFAIKRIG